MQWVLTDSFAGSIRLIPSSKEVVLNKEMRP